MEVYGVRTAAVKPDGARWLIATRVPRGVNEKLARPAAGWAFEAGASHRERESSSRGHARTHRPHPAPGPSTGHRPDIRHGIFSCLPRARERIAPHKM